MATENKEMIFAISTVSEMEALEKAVSKAIDEAMKMANTGDGGTCNFDECLLDVKIPKRLANKSWLKLRKREYGFYKGAYEIMDLPVYGQGDRRTRMAEAACKSLCAQGYSAFVHYQMD